MAYQSENLMDCGYFYCPYVDLDDDPVEIEYNGGDYRMTEEPPKVEWKEEGF